MAAAALAGAQSKVWVADKGDGTYKNPILHADFSDPDVLRVGEDYYLTAFSFNAVPGLPVLPSKDLVNWELIGHVYGARGRPRSAITIGAKVGLFATRAAAGGEARYADFDWFRVE
jgi:beta-xylosidase